MKKVLATILALVSLLSSLAVVTSANEDNSNNGALVVYDDNTSNGALTVYDDEVKNDAIVDDSKDSICSENCHKDFQDCKEVPPFVTSKYLENKYKNCVKALNSCLKENCLDEYMQDNKDKSKFGDLIVDLVAHVLLLYANPIAIHAIWR